MLGQTKYDQTLATVDQMLDEVGIDQTVFDAIRKGFDVRKMVSDGKDTYTIFESVMNFLDEQE